MYLIWLSAALKVVANKSHQFNNRDILGLLSAMNAHAYPSTVSHPAVTPARMHLVLPKRPLPTLPLLFHTVIVTAAISISPPLILIIPHRLLRLLSTRINSLPTPILGRPILPPPPPILTPDNIKTENTNKKISGTFGTPPGINTPHRAGLATTYRAEPASHQDASARTLKRAATNYDVKDTKKAAKYISQKLQGRKFKGGSPLVADDVPSNAGQPHNSHSLFANVLEGPE